MTNQQFIESYLVPLGYEQSFTLLTTSRELLQRYGTQMQILLKQVPEYEDVSVVVALLKKYDKLSKTVLDALLHQLGTFFQESEKTYTFSSSHMDDAVLKKLAQAFPDVTIETRESSRLGVELTGGGNIYRRSLETDLQKIRESK